MDNKDIQIDILAQTIGVLHKEIAELRTFIIQEQQKKEEAEGEE